MTKQRSPVPHATVLALVATLALCEAGFSQMAESSGPSLRNEKVTYCWAALEYGSGLIAIEDHVHQTSLLNPTSSAAPWWQVKLKDGRIITNTDLPCRVETQAKGLTFTWTGEMRVVVKTQLGAHDTLLRARIRVEALKDGVGLRDVVFPIVDGIQPLTKDAGEDRLLQTFRTG